MNYAFLNRKYEETPGLVVDKLKAVLEFVWSILKQTDRKGIIFAYDEAQNLSDNAPRAISTIGVARFISVDPEEGCAVHARPRRAANTVSETC